LGEASEPDQIFSAVYNPPGAGLLAPTPPFARRSSGIPFAPLSKEIVPSKAIATEPLRANAKEGESP
jgi:hypothetical protein